MDIAVLSCSPTLSSIRECWFGRSLDSKNSGKLRSESYQICSDFYFSCIDHVMSLCVYLLQYAAVRWQCDSAQYYPAQRHNLRSWSSVAVSTVNCMAERQHHYKIATRNLMKIEYQIEPKWTSFHFTSRTYLISSWFGNTLYVWMSFLGKRSDNRSIMYEPMPEPVPPAIAAIRFTINDIEYFLVQFLTLAKTRRPIISSTTAVFR